MATEQRRRAEKGFEQALAHLRAGAPAKAEAAARKALKADNGAPRLHHLLGVALAQQNKFAAAVSSLHAAADRAPGEPSILSDLGQCQRKAGRATEAIATFRRLLAIRADDVNAMNDLGNALADTGDAAAAEIAFRDALRRRPDFPLARYNLARLLMRQGAFAAAADELATLARAGTDDRHTLNNLGVCLMELRRYNEALQVLEQALRWPGEQTTMLENLVRLLLEMGNVDRALEVLDTFEAAAAPSPWSRASRVAALTEAGRLGAGDIAAGTADPEAFAGTDGKALADLVSCCRVACAWPSADALGAVLDTLSERALAAGDAPPERMISVLRRSDDPARHTRMLAGHAGAIMATMPTTAAAPAIVDGVGERRLRVGYLSSDIRNHVVAHLVHGLFVVHDRDAFEVHVFSRGSDDDSVYRRRIEETAEHFHDLAAADSPACAQAIADAEIDVLVDLNGWSGSPNLEVLGRRPAPVRISMIGYPGSLGHGLADYTVVDPVVAPPEIADGFSETLIYVPSFFCVTSPPPEAEADDGESETPSRAGEGLADGAAVLAAFNKADKLDAATFRHWLEILTRVPEAVLWLQADLPATTENLCRLAGEAGIDADRLVFAGRTSKTRHLQRLALADLALDTPIYNGGATTADMLWAGLPLVATIGRGFPARVSASQLAAVGLRDELCAADMDDYVELAVALAGDRARRQRLRDTLLAPPARAALFDVAASARRLEGAYRAAFRNTADGGTGRMLDPFNVL